MAAMTRPPRRDRFGNSPWLQDWLNRPAVIVPLQDLPSLWRRTDVHFVCDRPQGMQSGLWMARSVRGAFGRILKRWHEQTRLSGLPASAFEGLFQSHAMLDGVHIPKPIGFHVCDWDGGVMVRIRLFGNAAMWRDEVIEAMSVALAQGIGLWENGRILRPWPQRDWWWIEHGARQLQQPSDRAVLAFDTPFKPGGADLFAGDLLTAIPSLAARIRGMARWSGVDLPLEIMRLRLAAESLKCEALPPGSYLDGFVKLRDGGDLAVVGMLGAFRLGQVFEELWALLTLGEDTGIGGYRAYGFGNYRLFAA